MNMIKKVASSTKKFVVDHKVAVAVIVTTVVMARISRHAMSEHDNFLKDNDLYDAFYHPADA